MQIPWSSAPQVGLFYKYSYTGNFEQCLPGERFEAILASCFFKGSLFGPFAIIVRLDIGSLTGYSTVIVSVTCVVAP